MTLWDVSTGTYENKSFYVGGLEISSRDVLFNPDGNRMFVIGTRSKTVYAFILSTPWDVDTASLVNSLYVGGLIDSPTSICFNSNGFRLYVAGRGKVDRLNRIFQYQTWDYDVGEDAIYSGSLNVDDELGYPHGVFIGPNDTKLYIISSPDERIFQFTLEVPSEISTGTYDGKSLYVGGKAILCWGVFLSSDGSKAYMTGSSLWGEFDPSETRVFQYTLSTLWDISTGSDSGKNLALGGQDEQPSGLFFRPDGNKLFVIGRVNAKVFQYILPGSPLISVQAAADVEFSTATGNGTITDTRGENATKRGVCWSTTSNPTIADDKSEETNSFGIGAFTRPITGLSPGTRYYVKAYAYNSIGYGYSETEVKFTTKLAAPTNIQATDGVHTDKVVITWTKSAGATYYEVYRDDVAIGWLGDVDTFNDTGAGAPTITPGSVTASDGSSTAHVALSNIGASTNNGTTHTYKVKAFSNGEYSDYSETDTGYRGVGALTYQWYRSAGDGDASYSEISGATASTYNDTDAPAPTVTPGTASASDGSSFDYVSLSLSGQSTSDGAGRYYKCYHTAEGVTPGYTGTNRGYRGAGSLTYQWQRSAEDSDSDYSNITGATSDTHNDTAAPIPTITPGITIASDGAYAAHIALSLSGQSADGEGRYYVCVLNANGSDEETSSSDRGYRSVGDLTYQWQRSAADSDASYSNISSATAATYNDTGAPSDGSGRYYKCVEDATGADQQISATDRGHRITLATVTTQAVSDIGEFSAIGNVTITDIGYEHCSKRGVCWNTTGSPTVADDTSEETNSFGIGAFTRLMTSLTSDTTYYVKGYAYNSAGYSYGGEVEFTTETTQAATVITLAPTLVEDGIANLILALISKDDLIINPVGWYCDENAAPSTEYTETGWRAGGGGADLALGIYSKYIKTLPTGHSTLYVQAWCDDDGSNRYTGSIASFDIPSKPEYTNLPDIIFPELPEIPAIEIDLPDINYDIGLDLYLDRTYTRKDLEELRQKCINYEKNYTDFCLILNHNTLLVKNFLQSAYNNGVLGGENEMFTKIHPSQQLTPLYLEPLEPNDFKGIINRFINNNTSNSMGLNHNFDLFTEWLNDYNYTSDGYKASYITPKEEIITNNEPTVKYLTNKINRLQREVSMASREITHNFNLMKEIIQ